MVSHSVEASWRLYICMPAKSSRDRREDSAKEVPVPTTGDEKKSQAKIHSGAQPANHFQVTHPPPHGDLQEPPGPHTQVPACPEEMLVPWKTRTRQLYRGYREKRATPTPTPARAARASRRCGLPITPRPWVQSVPLEKEGSQSRRGCLYASVGANVDLLSFFLYAPWMQRPLAARRK